MRTKQRVLTGLLLSAALGMTGSLPAHAEADPELPVTERISTAYDGAQLDRPSHDPEMGEGRVTAFTTDEPSGPNGAGALPGVFINAQSVDEVSYGADGPSYDGAPCSSGRMVGFVSESTTLDSRPHPDHRPRVCIRNRSVGKLTGLHSYQGVEFTSMGRPRVDPSCQWITFTATLPATDTDPAPQPRVYRFKFNGGTTDLVSEASDEPADNASISHNGRYVAYEQGGDIYVRDLDTGGLEKASVARNGGAANGGSSAPSLSADGRRVAFDSRASNLAPGDKNRATNVFVRDLDSGTTTLVKGAHKKDCTAQAALSGDGTHVAFTSGRSSGKRPAPAVYLRELATGDTQLISTDRDGRRNDLAAGEPSVNADGTVVAFASASPDLVAGDTNGVSDIFLRTVR
ncbi:TolB family protein [Streptomyces sp. NPDC058274]|uniref:TolB family protein n=1 Tax=Streptomyces sp. NPDC058274 TaxID=3346416 RepID=UPI0036E511EE